MCDPCRILLCCFTGSLFLLWPGPAAGATERFVIDTDAGVDDAVAILTLLGDQRIGHLIQGITCVRGNAEVDNVAINVLKTLKIADRTEIPVHYGAAYGLIRNPPLESFYGKDGFGDADYPEPPSLDMIKEEHAAVYLASLVQKYPGEVTILMLGPLTNVAIAMRLNPNFLAQVKKVIVLGGDLKASGRFRPNVDFNFYMDPDAAALVIQGMAQEKKKITIISIQAVTENFIDIKWRLNTLGVLNSTKVEFLNRIEKSTLTEDIWESYDLFAAVTLIHPSAVTKMQELYVDVETEGRLTRGVLVVDYHSILKLPPNADVVFSIDNEIVKSVALQNLK